MRILLLSLFVTVIINVTAQSQSIKNQLDSLSALYNFTIEELVADSLFKQKFLLRFEQPINHTDPSGKSFTQRVFLSHISYHDPVVFITEGYTAWHAESPRFVSELAGILNSNQICVEHRYFGESVPDSIDWEQLTVSNSAADHHRIVDVLKLLYKDKWIGTGISKGGQTSMYHRYFYPDDVDVSVPYVAPLNFSTEEKRVYMFLDSVGNSECRERIFQFQRELLKNKSNYIDAFEQLAQERKLSFRMGMEKAFELTVFEYSFAFWQWGYFDCNNIPDDFSNADSIIRHLDRVSGINWVSNEGIASLQAFFYQAMREIGFYGYNIEPFSKWVSYEQNPTFEFTLPEDVSVTFEPQLMQEVDCFIRHHAKNMIFIYGEYDPWSAPAVNLTHQNNLLKIVKPKGNHRTRINNLPAKQRKLVLETLNNWLQH